MVNINPQESLMPTGLFENLGRDLAIAAAVIFLLGFGIGYWF